MLLLAMLQISRLVLKPSAFFPHRVPLERTVTLVLLALLDLL